MADHIHETSARTVVITGASSGIGKAAARQFAAQGWNVIGHGRDAARCAAAEAEIKAAAAPGVSIAMLRADLSLVSEAAALAQAIAKLAPRIDALLLNAGGVRAEQALTAEGNEATFAGNHLGHFVLALALLPQLRVAVATSGPGNVRVITTSSEAHRQSPPFDWSDPQMLQGWSSIPAYGRAKLYNILFAREFGRRFGGEGIVAHAMHPGIVDTNFASHGDTALQSYFETADAAPPERSAATLAFLADAAEPGRFSGGYWYDCAEAAPTAQALDDEAAAQLWELSEQLAAKTETP